MFFFAAIYLAALASLYFSQALGGAFLLTERDLGVYFLPPRHLWVEILKNGEFPLWNPYSYSGHPLLATLQPGIFYPVNIILLIFPFDLAFNLSIVVHFFLAGIFTYALVRELKGGKWGSLASAVAFMLGGYLFSAHNVMSTLFSAAWTPLAVFLFLRALRRASSGYAVLTGIVMTVMFTGGGIEVFLGTFGLISVLAFFPGIFDFDGAVPRARLVKRAALLIITSVVFLSLGAVQLFPFIELARHSTRAGGLSFFEATTWSLDVKDFVQFLIPDPFGYGVSEDKYWANQSWLKTIYTGAVPFVLSIFFFIKAKRRAVPFALLGLVFLSLSMGRNFFFYQYLHAWAPFFDKFRYPVKFLFAPFLFISIATGLGLDGLVEAAGKQRKSALKVIVFLLAAATLSAAAFGYLGFSGPEVKAFLVERGIDYPEYNRAEINIFNTKRLLAFFIVFSIGLYFAYRSKATRLLPWFVVAMLSIDLFFAHEGYYFSTKSETYYDKGNVMGFMTGRMAEEENGLFRVFVTPKTMDVSVEVKDAEKFDRDILKRMDLHKERLTGYNLLFRVFDINGVEVMKRGDYASLYDIMTRRSSIDATNIPSLLNVRYVVSIPEIRSKRYRLVKVIGALPGATGVEAERALKIYENLDFVPRFNLAADYRVITKSDEFASIISGTGFDPKKTVFLEEVPWQGGGQADGRPLRNCKVEVVSYRMNSVELHTNCSERSVLVASESWYPGWKAFVDGKEERILKADYVLRAVPLEGGAHVVRFEYRPMSFRAGAWVSSAAALSLAAFGIFHFGMKRRD
ncbi:MAG: hypothetical protein A2X93_09615 [Deltaproteobacteria bacterium GWC2_56_8]|nr:MAG: hypothetical protein A2X93_09615 [Deltaproteobacteria bacterium GWC2_56_8]